MNTYPMRGRYFGQVAWVALAVLVGARLVLSLGNGDLWVAGWFAAAAVGLGVLILPVIGVLVMPALDAWFYAFQVGGLPVRSYLLVLVLCLVGLRALIARKKNVRSFPGVVRSAVWLSLALYAWMIVSTALAVIIWRQDVSMASLLRGIAGRALVGLPIALCVFCLVDTRKKLIWFTGAFILPIALSALVGIFQSAGMEFAWDLRSHLAPPPFDIPDEELSEIDLARQRVPGLANYSIPLSYQLVLALPLCVGMLIGRYNREKGMSPPSVALLCVVVILGWGALVNDTRSAVVGVSAAALAMWIGAGASGDAKAPGRRRWASIVGPVGVALVTTVVIWMATGGPSGRWSSDVIRRPEEIARIPLWLYGVLAGLENPLGLGWGGLGGGAARDYYSVLASFPGAETVLVTSSHNHLLNIFAYFGIPGVVLGSVFYYRLVRDARRLVRRGDANGPDGRGAPAAGATHGSAEWDGLMTDMATGVWGAFLAILVHIQFHNAGLFNGDLIGWYVVGMLWALYRIREETPRGSR